MASRYGSHIFFVLLMLVVMTVQAQKLPVVAVEQGTGSGPSLFRANIGMAAHGRLHAVGVTPKSGR
jgi:hypothetical protein